MATINLSKIKWLVILVQITASIPSVINQTQESLQNNKSISNESTTTILTTTFIPESTLNSNNSEISENVTVVSSQDELSKSTTVSPFNMTNGALMSVNEFVDFTETPLILIDGVSNTTEEVTTTSSPSEKSSSLPQVPTQQPRNGTNTSISKVISEEVTTKEPEITNQANSTTTSSTVNGNSTAIAGDNVTMLDESDDTNGSSEDNEETSEFDAREAKSTFEPPKNVSQYMDYIERLFHDLRHQITDLFEPHIPQLIRTSQMVELSGSCSYDMLRMALALRQFEPWALRMIDSSGKMPEGIFEGSFTALGSYDECLGTVFASSSGQQQQALTQGKYCLVNVSPFLPPKPPADKVERIFQEEANRRNYTKDDQFSRLSPMFYYMKFRIGVCIPSSCIDSDLDSISSALSVSLRLNITIPHCRTKQTQPITSHQLIGGLVFTLVVVLVAGATIMDYWRRKLYQMKRRGIVQLSINNQKQLRHSNTEKAVKVIPSQASRMSPPVLSYESLSSNKNYSLPLHLTKATVKEVVFEVTNGGTTINECNGLTSSTRAGKSFNERLEKHWTWMSFSLITNFKLYFTRILPTRTKTSISSTPKSNIQQQQLHSPQVLPVDDHQQQLIKCLDGIRVLSLCWVILANSYITLDPRATKRLSVTRDAPKNFLFQLVVQASLAIETFFFLSGVLVSISYARKFRAQQQVASTSLQWIQFYVHRYIRMTPATMLVIAFTMFAFRFGDGPLWFEATHKAHLSCSENWWRHLLHVANFIDTRQMCFIHYWYIAADMQLFLFAPLLMFLLHKRPRIAYIIVAIIGCISVSSVFYTTYIRNLPPTLLFYNTDPESRREYGNTIMTKPLTHALPYMVGMLIGKWLSSCQSDTTTNDDATIAKKSQLTFGYQNNRSLTTLLGLTASLIALAEVFLPYKWNNSHLPTRFLASAYAALFRFFWSLALAYLVISCAHKKDKRCRAEERRRKLIDSLSLTSSANCNCSYRDQSLGQQKRCTEQNCWPPSFSQQATSQVNFSKIPLNNENSVRSGICVCGSGGSLVNRLLGLSIFTHLSKLSFVAYLIHLPLMSVFVSQTRGLFAFSHTLVIHLALSYLIMTTVLSFVLVHIIEFPFITFERYLFEKLSNSKSNESGVIVDKGDGHKSSTTSTSTSAVTIPHKELMKGITIGAKVNDNSTRRSNLIGEEGRAAAYQVGKAYNMNASVSENSKISERL